jgi:hypothetical protein
MSLSNLLQPLSIYNISCNKLTLETFNASLLSTNETPTIEMISSLIKSDLTKLVPVQGVLCVGNSQLADRDNVVNLTTINLELGIPSNATSGEVYISFWWYNITEQTIGEAYGANNKVFTYKPRGLEEVVSVNLSLPWYNDNVAPSINYGTNYTMFAWIFNTTGEFVTVKQAFGIPVIIRILQW